MCFFKQIDKFGVFDSDIKTDSFYKHWVSSVLNMNFVNSKKHDILRTICNLIYIQVR